MMEPAALANLLDLLRSHGVTRYEDGPLKVELGPAQAPPQQTAPPKPPQVDAMSFALKLRDESLEGDPESRGDIV